MSRSNDNDIQGGSPVNLPSQARGFTFGGTGAPPKTKSIAPVALTKMSTASFISSAIPQQILAANKLRNYLLIQNNGLNTLFVGFGTTPNLNGFNALQLPANTGISFETGICPNNEVTVVSTSETLVTVIEGIRM
jgi:hypothetical protein